MKSLIFALSAFALPGPVLAQALVGESNYVHLSDLANAGFEPFATSGQNGASFGMKKGSDMYFCFSADREEFAAVRREKLSAEVRDESPDRKVPNIFVACVAMQ